MFIQGYDEWVKALMERARENKFDYIIEIRKSASVVPFNSWYFFDLVETDSFKKVIWTPTQRLACLFPSEREVEEFKADYISPRKASIIRLDKTTATLSNLLTF